MLIIAVLHAWVRAQLTDFMWTIKPRTGKHRGAGRATRAAYRHRTSTDGAHTGSLYGVTYVLTQSTRGLRWAAHTPMPTAAYPVVATA
jgi:hypothetical protein